MGIEVCRKPSSAPALAGNVSSPLKGSWRWGSSGGGHSNSSSPPPPSTSWNHCALCPQFPRSARASGRLCPSWHLFPDSFHLTWVPSPLQMSPRTSVGLGLETGSTTIWYPCSGKSCGGLLPCLQVSHCGRSPGELINILQTWIICVGGYWSISDYWSIGSYQSGSN